MQKTTAQSQIIAHLMNGKGFDAQAICAALAQYDPVLFCHLAKMQSMAPDWAREAFAFLENEELIPAIKAIRAGTRFGLKDSKDICDAFRQYENGAHWSSLSQECYEAFNELRKAAGRDYL